jgi:hypothetical protein
MPAFAVAAAASTPKLITLFGKPIVNTPDVRWGKGKKGNRVK